MSPGDKTTSTISRRSLLRGLTSVSLTMLLMACGNRDEAGPPLPSVSLDAFPDTLGRGYPLGSLEGTDNTNTGLRAGDIAPNFRLQLDDREGLYLSDLVGHPILINFWATWCGPCRLEMPEIVHRSSTASDLIVLAVNVQEEPDPIAAFASDFNMTMPVVRDVDAKIRDLYQIRGMPTSVFVDREGKVASYWEGVLTPSRLEELLAAIL